MTTSSSSTGVRTKLQSVNREFSEKEVAEKAKRLEYGYTDLTKMPINLDYLRIISKEKAIKTRIVCFFAIGKKVRIAFEDAQNEYIESVIQGLKMDGYSINMNLVSTESIDHALSLYEEVKEKKIIDNKKAEISIESAEKEISSLKDLQEKIEQVPIQEALNLLHIGALRTHTSDIHFQPEEKNVHIRFRIDGVLQSIFSLSHKTYEGILRQIKHNAKLKMNITKTPQDGQYAFTASGRKIDVRTSLLPTAYAESVVLRLLDSSRNIVPLDKLGLYDHQLQTIYNSLKNTNGMILMTGPTGAGKTTTLYALLSILNTKENKIITIEDPIEYELPGIVQSQIHEEEGYTFEAGLEAILRQDPNVIMIGEIRNPETAGTAAQAALTGHKVLSTLHTNNSFEAITRMIHMGVPPYILAPSLMLVVAQRLIRTLCKECSQMRDLRDIEKQYLEKSMQFLKKSIPEKIPEAIGCQKCSHTGYSGQTALSEVLSLSPQIKSIIETGAYTSIATLEKQARLEGFCSLKEDGIQKMLEKKTTLSEVLRVSL